MNLAVISAIVFLVNIPFGYWRSRAKTFSVQWFLAVHLPVPLVVALRVFGGLGWQYATFPVLIGAFFGGQYLGARLDRD